MAEVTPFRGIRYNPEKIEDMSKVVTPPYDVISTREQAAFHASHPHNIIRLILNMPTSADCTGNDCHTRAAACYESWLQEGILKQDDTPSLYLTSLEFPLDGETVRRFGLIAAVRLEPFEKGIILPHERTFSKIKSERLALMKRCHTNFSPIFSVYGDSEDLLGFLRDVALGKAPEMTFTDTDGFRHQLWRITDPPVVEQVTRAMADKRIYIADGHHRYETALVYRDWVAETTPGFRDDHPANRIMMCLSSMEDPGLVILPAHRMIRRIDAKMRDRLLREAPRYFRVTTIPADDDLDPVQSALAAGEQDHTLAIFLKGDPTFYLLTLKPGVMERELGEEMAAPLLDLDVVILTRLILVRIFGFDQADLDDNTRIDYTSRMAAAVEGVAGGDCDVAFLMNPTRMEQVREIAESGLIMPRKSTFFYPKVITGQVIKSLMPHPPNMA